MFSTLRTRFGIPGVISVMALVFAMFGGAYAASNSSGGGKATASAKAKKGPRGPKGATGPAGPAGPQGPAGANGKDGSNGANGSNGTTGTPGQSVTSTVEPPGAHCEEGGFKLASASGTQYVCNGLVGENGQTGFTETLPSGKTETGTWFLDVTHEGQNGTAISFPIPLEEPIAEENVVTLKESEATKPGCPGSTSTPEAEPGYFCLYTKGEGTLSGFFNVQGSTPGMLAAFISFAPVPAPQAFRGVWAVTAP
jgi:hypothetical protein